MSSPSKKTTGLTLLEMLLVLVAIALLVGIVIPHSEPNLHDQLRATAQIVAMELNYGRSLALSYNSTYRFTFQHDENRLVLQHSGGNTALNPLPDSPFRAPEDPAEEHIVDLDDLPHLGAAVRLETTAAAGSDLAPVFDVEFGPLGSTNRGEATVLWLAAGAGEHARYITITIDPMTGLAKVGTVTDVCPAIASVPPS